MPFKDAIPIEIKWKSQWQRNQEEYIKKTEFEGLRQMPGYSAL